ncbi:MAG: SIMPL domain-containing protein [Propionibacteriaceae bacterium]|jgi:hypothetical protein|nr:SIMPL domain-containing protein [Propionibacteriaceae bacterium]
MGILRVTVDDTTVVHANRARLFFHLAVRSKSAAWPHGTDQPAAEVSELTRALQHFGIPANQVLVDPVSDPTAVGLLRSNDRTCFHLTATVQTDQVATVLGLLADRSNARLVSLEWLYDDYEATLPILAASVAKARRKAEILARAAHVVVTGIAHLSDSWSVTPSALAAETAAGEPEFRSLLPDRPLDPAIALTGNRELAVHLTVDFEIKPSQRVGGQTSPVSAQSDQRWAAAVRQAQAQPVESPAIVSGQTRGRTRTTASRRPEPELVEYRFAA